MDLTKVLNTLMVATHSEIMSPTTESKLVGTSKLEKYQLETFKCMIKVAIGEMLSYNACIVITYQPDLLSYLISTLRNFDEMLFPASLGSMLEQLIPLYEALSLEWSSGCMKKLSDSDTQPPIHKLVVFVSLRNAVRDYCDKMINDDLITPEMVKYAQDFLLLKEFDLIWAVRSLIKSLAVPKEISRIDLERGYSAHLNGHKFYSDSWRDKFSSKVRALLYFDELYENIGFKSRDLSTKLGSNGKSPNNNGPPEEKATLIALDVPVSNKVFSHFDWEWGGEKDMGHLEKAILVSSSKVTNYSDDDLHTQRQILFKYQAGLTIAKAKRDLFQQMLNNLNQSAMILREHPEEKIPGVSEPLMNIIFREESPRKTFMTWMELVIKHRSNYEDLISQAEKSIIFNETRMKVAYDNIMKSQQTTEKPDRVRSKRKKEKEHAKPVNTGLKDAVAQMHDIVMSQNSEKYTMMDE